MAGSTLIRVNKLLAARGVFSRREADDALGAGMVTLLGRRVQKGERVPCDAPLEVHPTALAQQQRAVTIALHKPMGFISQVSHSTSLPRHFTSLTAQARGILSHIRRPTRGEASGSRGSCSRSTTKIAAAATAESSRSGTASSPCAAGSTRTLRACS